MCLGEMSFEINGEPITDVSPWESESDIWYKTANYIPDIWDSGNTISCILKQGSQEAEVSTLTLDVSMFEFGSESSKDVKNLKDGQEIAEFSVEFKAYPKADQSKISWIIYDASDDVTTVLKPGKCFYNLKILNHILKFRANKDLLQSIE